MKRELPKNWSVAFHIHPANQPLGTGYGKATKIIERDWKGLTRTQALAKLLSLILWHLRRSKLKYPRLRVSVIFGKKPGASSYSTIIRARHKLDRLERLKGLTPREIFVIGEGSRAHGKVVDG